MKGELQSASVSVYSRPFFLRPSVVNVIHEGVFRSNAFSLLSSDLQRDLFFSVVPRELRTADAVDDAQRMSL